MLKEKINDPIVCDTLGCGELAKVKLTFKRTGTSVILCEKCMAEIEKLVKESGCEKR